MPNKSITKKINKMALPKISKVVVNCSLADLHQDKNLQKQVLHDLALITGQKPNILKAKKSIAGFKLRQGQKIGVKITLRGKRMQDFISRLINITFPRTRDFHGIPEKSFDNQGNLTIGIKDHSVFPEIISDDIQKVFSFEITIATTATAKAEAIKLLKKLKFPILWQD